MGDRQDGRWQDSTRRRETEWRGHRRGENRHRRASWTKEERDDSATGRKVWVKGATKRDSEELLWKIAKSARMDLGRIDVIWPAEEKDGKAFILFASSHDARVTCEFYRARTIRFDGREFGFELCALEEENAPVERQTKTLRIYGFPPETSVLYLTQQFRRLSSVDDVVMSADKSCAYVQFSTTKDCMDALQFCSADDGKFRLSDGVVLRVEDPETNQELKLAALMAHRVVASSSTVPISLPHIQAMEEWPKPFESSGTSFSFDPVSGLYFDKRSQFYFEPNTRVYFSCMKQRYFRYDNMENTFVETDPPPSVNNSAVQANQEQQWKEDIPSARELKQEVEGSTSEPKIEMKIKATKKRKRALVELPSSFGAAEQHQNEKTREEERIQIGDDSGIRNSKLVLSNQNLKNIQMWKSTQEKVLRKREVSLKFVCSLCKRKFPSQDKLERHIALSSMHQANLASAGPTTENQTYVDRAAERRKLFLASNEVPSESIAQDQGNQIKRESKGFSALRAMGWQEGDTLGIRGTGLTAPLDAKSMNSKVDSSDRRKGIGTYTTNS